MKQLDLRVNNRFKLIRKLGRGGFGSVYEGLDIETNNPVAIKLERALEDGNDFLQSEAQLYRSLAGGVCVPRVYWYGTDCQYNAMVFDLLGPNLEDLFNYCGRKFSLKTVLMLADQLISRLRLIHSHDIIHRDIKPENFLMGAGKSGNHVYVTDMGLAMSEYAATGKRSNGLLGTARYASVNGHLGNEQSPADDLESLGYVLIYFLRGSLPWQGLKASSKEAKCNLVLEKKQKTKSEELCEDLPSEFAAYMSDIRSLGPDGEPDYRRLRKRFQDLFVRSGFEHDNVFDWTILKFIESQQTTAKTSIQTTRAKPPRKKSAPQRVKRLRGGRSKVAEGVASQSHGQ